MINLRKITIEGFGSVIKPIIYALDRMGINKIEGVNGVGKTTITNALAWVGWGQLVKPKKSSYLPWPHIIDSTFMGTKVELEFDDGKDSYTIIRCTDYKGKFLGKKLGNRLVVLENGKELNGANLRDKKDYQKWIINKIGYSFDLLKSTVLFTQELDSIMKEDGPGKKKVFDEAFETTFVNNAKKKVEERMDRRAKDIDKMQWEDKLSKEKLEGMRSFIKLAKQSINDFEENKEKRIKEVKTKKEIKEIELTTKEQDVKNYTPLWDLKDKLKIKEVKLKSASDAEFRSSMAMNSAQDKVETLQQKISQLKDQWQNPEKTCKLCKRALNPESVIAYKKEVQSQINIIKKEKESNEDKVVKLTEENRLNIEKLGKITKSIASIKTKTANVPKKELLEYEIQSLRKEIKGLFEEIRILEVEQPPKNDLRQKVMDLRALKKTRIEHRQSMKSLKKEDSIDRWLIKDPLSNSGLKAFIFDSMLGKVNNYLKEYTTIVGFGIRVFVDLESANKDIRIAILRGGDEVPFEDISKGQKQLVLVVLAFSMSDAVNSIKPINAIFLDELFESLSSENIEKVANIVINKSRNKSIHLITHLAAFSPSNAHTTHLRLNSKNQTIISSS